MKSNKNDDNFSNENGIQQIIPIEVFPKVNHNKTSDDDNSIKNLIKLMLNQIDEKYKDLIKKKT